MAVGVLVVVLFVMPAEYGLDPTGVGRLTGIGGLHAEPETPLVPPSNTTGHGLSNFNISWVPREALRLQQDGQLATGESIAVPFEVIDTNVTRVVAILQWSDEAVAGQQTGPDLFQLNLTSPSGETLPFLGRNEGPSGSLTATFTVNGVPPTTQVLAKDHQGALREARRVSPDRLEGTGRWVATVRLVEAGGLGPLATVDEGNAWSLRVFVQTFHAAVGDPQRTPVREDTVELTIPARGQVEFKARLDEGAEMRYDWQAATAIFYEFHGDAQGANGERFESYEQGTATGKDGTFKAPFTGRHGWYWRNDGIEDVRATLYLRGDYVIVGIV